MTAEERNRITSNDYLDLLVEYNKNMRTFEQYQNGTVHIMNDRFAVVYVPAAQQTGDLINKFGYTVIPACYGLCTDRSLEASGVERLRRLPNFNLRGQGVMIGIIDTGIDYTNPIFQNTDGTSRITAIWDQTIDSDNYPASAMYGTQYFTEDINRALGSTNPYDIVPSRDEIGHGTMLAGIAAGSENTASNFIGVAPDASIIAVKLKPAKQVLRDLFIISADVPCYQENDIIWAVQYIIDTARSVNRPVSIVIGLGSSQGSHDGRGALSSLISVAGDFPGVVITVAAGNEGNAKRHFYSEIDAGAQPKAVELNIGENETGFAMELWGSAPMTYSIDIVSPSGESIPRITESLQVNRNISFVFEKTRIALDYRMVESSTGDQLILLRFRNPSSGIWRFQVYGRGNLKGSFHIWLPMNGFITEDTYFVQSNPYTTITSPGNSIIPITVTAYNSENNNLYRQAGRGYSRIGTIKPEITAPGINIQSPDLNHGFTQMSGTSAAAAHTAGIAALILEWAIVRNNYPGVDSVEVKRFLIRGAKRNPNLTYPNRDWGYGILDIYNVFDTLRTDIQGSSS
jgi:subtilisin family serine protease